MNSPTFSKVCERIAAELLAVENERQLMRLSDPQYRAFLANLCRLALTADDAPTDGFISGLAEVEAAADALPREQKRKLLQFLASRVNGEKETKCQGNLAEFAGKLRLSEDPLAWQRRIRGEWE